MACPHFYPETPLPAERTPLGPRLPLVAAWSGSCRAHGLAVTPDERTLLACCNRGYARGECPDAAAAEGDAIRITLEGPLAGEGDTIGLIYTVEKDHWPVSHGRLVWWRNTGHVDNAPSAMVARQAEAFITAYLARPHNHEHRKIREHA
jgi:hypothetical protein